MDKVVIYCYSGKTIYFLYKDKLYFLGRKNKIFTSIDNSNIGLIKLNVINRIAFYKKIKAIEKFVNEKEGK